MGRRAAAAALAVAIALTLAGCSSTSAGQSESQTSFVAGDGSITVLEPGARRTAPAISGLTLDGTAYDSAEHLGDVQVMNVWASWCAPCRAEAPDLAAVHEAYSGKGVQFVGLNTRDSDTAARAFVERFGIAYPNVIDRDGVIQLGFRDTLPPQAIPSTVILDRQGRVAARILGVVSGASLRGVIDELLAEPA